MSDSVVPRAGESSFDDELFEAEFRETDPLLLDVMALREWMLATVQVSDTVLMNTGGAFRHVSVEGLLKLFLDDLMLAALQRLSPRRMEPDDLPQVLVRLWSRLQEQMIRADRPENERVSCVSVEQALEALMEAVQLAALAPAF
jgi:hypothetical protein